MNLFKSKFAKLEAFADAKPAERTPDMLAAAQAEMDTANSGVILVPKTDTVKSGADLQEHLNTLERRATTAEAASTKAAADLKKVSEELTALKAKEVGDGQAETPPSGKDTPAPGDQTPEQKEAAALRAERDELPHNKDARRMLAE